MDFYRISIRTFHTEKHPGKAPFAHFFSHPKRSRRRCRSSSPVALVGSVCVFFSDKAGGCVFDFFCLGSQHGFLFHPSVDARFQLESFHIASWFISSNLCVKSNCIWSTEDVQVSHPKWFCAFESTRKACVDEMYWNVLNCRNCFCLKMTKCLFLRWSRVTLRALFFGDVGPPRQADKCSHIRDYTTITPERGPDLGN